MSPSKDGVGVGGGGLKQSQGVRMLFACVRRRLCVLQQLTEQSGGMEAGQHTAIAASRLNSGLLTPGFRRPLPNRDARRLPIIHTIFL